MKTIKLNLYNFEELEKNIQEGVLDKFREINVEYDDWYEFILDEWKGKLKEYGYKDVKIYFELYGQSSGATIETKEIDLLVWLKKNKLIKKYKKLYNEIIRGYWCMVYIECYGNSNYSRVDYEGESDLSDKAYEQLQEVASIIKEEKEDFEEKIYKDLLNEYEYLTSDEAVKDTLIVNEYLFRRNGEVFYE